MEVKYQTPSTNVICSIFTFFNLFIVAGAYYSSMVKAYASKKIDYFVPV